MSLFYHWPTDYTQIIIFKRSNLQYRAHFTKSDYDLTYQNLFYFYAL